MSRRLHDGEYRRAQTVISAVYVLLLLTLSTLMTVATAAADEPRVSTTRHVAQGGRDAREAAVATEDVYTPLTVGGERLRPGAGTRADDGVATEEGEAPPTARSMLDDFWVYDADVALFGDDDRDGYFHGIDLLFDADTVYSSAVIYAVVWLSLDGGPWNEYAVSEDFRIEGARAEDEYVLVTELRSGYPRGTYDLLIELYDAASGNFLADFGPESSSALALLPLEDFNRDAPRYDPSVTVSRGHGGGSASLLFLVVLSAAAAARRLGRA